MEKEENLIGMSDGPEKVKKKSHLLAISLVLGMALFNVAAEQVTVMLSWQALIYYRPTQF